MFWFRLQVECPDGSSSASGENGLTPAAPVLAPNHWTQEIFYSFGTDSDPENSTAPPLDPVPIKKTDSPSSGFRQNDSTPMAPAPASHPVSVAVAIVDIGHPVTIL